MSEINKQETLEEAAEMYADKQSDASMRKNPLEYAKSGQELWDEAKTDFIAGAEWQAERMYSEEEVLNILYKHTECMLAGKKVTLEEWFEQFKKK